MDCDGCKHNYEPTNKQVEETAETIEDLLDRVQLLETTLLLPYMGREDAKPEEPKKIREGPSLVHHACY